MPVVNIHDAKTNLSRLIELASAGEEVIIAKAGKPVARLTPIDNPDPRKPGLAEGRLTEAFFDPLPPEEEDAWGQ